ncbi:MAG: ABC transporter permease [Anaerolineae bacterium]|jgi:ABC-2 type transport system permease protein
MIRNTLAIAWKDLLIVLKDRGVLAVYFLMPLLFASLLGMAFGNVSGDEVQIEIDILLVNQDTGSYGQTLADGLKETGVLVVEELADAAEADQRVADGDAPAAIVIPADFSAMIDAGEPVEIPVIQDPTQVQAAEIVAGIVNKAAAEVGLLGELRFGIHSVLAQAPDYDQAPPELVEAMEAQTLGVMWTQVQQMRQDPVIAVKGEAIAGTEEAEPWNPIDWYIPGFTVAFAFFLVGQMASSLLLEKEEGTFRRLLSSPMPRASIISGKILAYMVVVLLQVILLFTVGYALFQISLGDSPLALALLTLVLALASASLGLLLGALCRTSQQAERVGQVLGFVLLALGGTIFPTFNMEGLMGILSKLTPSAWAIQGYMGVMSEGWTLAQVAPNILILLGFAAVFFVLAVWRFRFD